MLLNKKFLVRSLMVLFVLLGILAYGQIDYTISNTIINKHSIWAEFFNMFGEVPAMFGLLLGTTILYGLRNKEVLWENILFSIIGLLFMFQSSFMICFMPIKYIFEFSKGGVPQGFKILSFVLAAIVFVSSVIIVNRISQENLRKFKKIAIVFILLVVLEILIVNILKVVWGRPRMRSIESIEQFKHWYQISGPTANNEFMSFPSGHTANGFVILAYSMFLPYFKKIKPNLFISFALTWGGLVALSRVVLGAHFLSDVLVGGYITILVFYTLNHIFIKDKNNEGLSRKERRVI